MGHVPVRQRNALGQLPQRRLVGDAVDRDLILLLHPAARVRDAVGPVAVVGQQQQTLRVAVEAAHGEEALGPIHQIEYRGAALGIAGRGHHAGRFVEHDVQVAGGRAADGAPIDRDGILGRVCLRPRLGHHLPVDGDAPLGQQPLGPATRGHARVGQYLIQTYAHKGIFHRLTIYRFG